MRRGLRRIHIWLGWIVGIPLLIWTLTGALMATFPIEVVRGQHLLDAPGPVALSQAPVPPSFDRPVRALTLEQRAAGPRWIVRYEDGAVSLADPANGRPIPALTAAEAEAEVRARYTGDEAIAGTERTSADDPPIDLRQPIESWRVTMTDGTRFYVNAGTGEIVARRTSLWRFYDFLWGLHILDLGEREDLNNIWLRIFAWIGTVAVVLALVLLPFTLRRRRRRARKD